MIFIFVKVKKLSNTAKIPIYSSENAACADLFADIIGIEKIDVGIDDYRLSIPPHSSIKIGTGLAFEPPKGYCGLIFARSGLSTKQGLRPANCVGICDEDYRGEYIVSLHNDTDETKFIKHGDRIAQLIFVPYQQFDFLETQILSNTERGNGGFGSTGE